MTNFDIEDEAAKYRLPLYGIYNKDKLPAIPKNGFYVINIQDDYDVNGNDLPGSHWTCIYIEGKHACYFDSFGLAPPLEVQTFMKNYIPYTYNTRQIQSIRSTVCGKYVVFFMLYIIRNKELPLKKRMEMFMRLWSTDVNKNREKLLEYLKKK